MRDQRGITLIETLVAMITGVVVTGALFSILDFSLNESTRISDVAQATQLGRSTMNRIIDEMHSSCLTAKYAPVREGSKENKLTLIDGYSKEAEIPTSATTGTGVHRDEIEYSSAARTLTDTYSLSTGVESSGEYRWATPVKVRIGENISQSVSESKTQPIFTYYEYAEHASTGNSTSAVGTLKEIPLSTGTSLTKAGAAKVASVLVQFNTAPTDNKGTLGRSVDLNSQVTFAFTAPNSESTIKAGPCE